MLTCTMMCAKVKIWPIAWHRVAYDFMHIATKMHESHMVGILENVEHCGGEPEPAAIMATHD